jgi:ABC-2 type transport system permease protein/lipopolysaccharide transport system permease protein
MGNPMRSVIAHLSAQKQKAPQSTPLTKAIADLRNGLNAYELWGTLGWRDLLKRYRRSSLGPFWLTLSMGIMAGTIGFLYAEVFDQPIHDYLPYLTVGIIVWGFISAVILDGCLVFTSWEAYIKQIPIPLSVHVFRMIWRNLIILAHNMVIYVIVLVSFGIWPGISIVLVIPSLFLLTIFGFWFGLLLGLLSARFRDLPQIVKSVTQLLFLFTPVLWRSDQLTGNRYLIAQLNPLYYFVEVMRRPLLGEVPPVSTWIAVIIIVALVSTVAFWFYVRFRARIAYWVDNVPNLSGVMASS